PRTPERALGRLALLIRRPQTAGGRRALWLAGVPATTPPAEDLVAKKHGRQRAACGPDADAHRPDGVAHRAVWSSRSAAAAGPPRPRPPGRVRRQGRVRGTQARAEQAQVEREIVQAVPAGSPTPPAM